MKKIAALLVVAFLAPAATAQDSLKVQADKHKKDVTKMRGLDFKKEVNVGVYSKEELQKFILAEFEKEMPLEETKLYQRGYAKFGLVPEDLDLHAALVDLLSESIAGFYHPHTKELKLIESDKNDPVKRAMKAQGIDMDAITLVHELTHAAQDQHFELSSLPLDDETNDDMILAIKGVIEGDASIVGWKFGMGDRFALVIPAINMQYKQAVLPGKAGKLPAYLRQWLTFPYGYGTEFVMKNGTNDLKKNSNLFEDFPLSSEQILHPEKYYDERDNPMILGLPRLDKTLGGGWKETFNNVHGEFVVSILLKEFRSDRLRSAVIRKAHEGWDGDRYSVLENGKGGVMYVWATTWDSEKDAQEFHDAYLLALMQKYGVLEAAPETFKDRESFESKDGNVLVERRGSDVLVFDGAPQEMLEKSGAVWDLVTRKELTKVVRLKRFLCDGCKTSDAWSGDCPKCGKPYRFDETVGRKKKKGKDGKKQQPREFSVGR